MQFATSKLPSFVKSLSSANFDKIFAYGQRTLTYTHVHIHTHSCAHHTYTHTLTSGGSESTVPKVLLFTDKAATTTLYKGLSVEFKDRLLLTEVKKSDAALGMAYTNTCLCVYVCVSVCVCRKWVSVCEITWCNL